jgi:hypothetical protein
MDWNVLYQLIINLRVTKTGNCVTNGWWRAAIIAPSMLSKDLVTQIIVKGPVVPDV